MKFYIGCFERPTYGLMQLPSLLDYELRLYLPPRLSLNYAQGLLLRAEKFREDFLATRPFQLEANRSGMCVCISCGPMFRQDILDAVNDVRKMQKLKPIKL